MASYNFTDSVRKALQLAREEALRLGHDYVGTEHLLLGLTLLEGLLQKFGVDPEAARARVHESVRTGSGSRPLGELPYTSRAKKVLELAMAEARSTRRSVVGPEHLLMGVLRERKGIGGQILISLGLEVEAACRVVASGGPAAGSDRAGEARRRAPRYRPTELEVILRNAWSHAAVLRHDYVGTGHLLLVLLKDADLMPRLGLRTAAVRECLERCLRPGQPDSEAYSLAAEGSGRGRGVPLSSAAMRAMERAAENGEPAPVHLLLAMLAEPESTAARALASLGLHVEAAPSMMALDDAQPAREPETGTGFRITIDEASESASIYQQIVDQVREGVATGALQPGERLPTVRSLSDELDIAPGTVARAYSELERLGVVVTEGARGTRVAHPRREDQPSAERTETLAGLLRPVAVAAFHMGGTADELRAALDRAMDGILGEADAA